MQRDHQNSWGPQNYTWKKPWKERIEENNLWELSDPKKATFRAGATDDAILIAKRDYIPQGLMQDTQDYAVENNEIGIHFPVHIAKKRIIGEHTTLFLDT